MPFWLENTAGVWVVAAFVAGVLVRRPFGGAVAGAGALVMGLVLHDSIWFVTGDGFSVQVMPSVRPLWMVVSTVVGAAVGALGGWSRRGQQRWWIGVGLVCGVLVGEVAALLAGGPPHPAFHAGVGAAQAAVGVAVLLVAVRGGARWRALALAATGALLLAAVEVATGLVSRLIWG